LFAQFDQELFNFETPQHQLLQTVTEFLDSIRYSQEPNPPLKQLRFIVIDFAHRSDFFTTRFVSEPPVTPELKLHSIILILREVQAEIATLTESKKTTVRNNNSKEPGTSTNSAN